MPAITPISDGSFIASLHVGLGLSSLDNRIEILRSENGRDWFNEGSIRGGPPAEDGWSYWRPKISEVPDGRMVMISTRFKAGSENLFDPHADPDGRIAAIYNCRKDPQGIRIAVMQDLERFDVENEIIIFDAGAEATLGKPETDNFLAEHLTIGFDLPCGVQLHDGTVLVYFWCTVGGVTQSSWMRLRVS